MAFDIIDRVPSILLNDPNAVKVDPKKVEGRIEFRNVTFTYPTRPG
jgi:ATP-binding cassette subfamily B (MDR/TAP) protein 1